jgi:hypothetical protein
MSCRAGSAHVVKFISATDGRLVSTRDVGWLRSLMVGLSAGGDQADVADHHPERQPSGQLEVHYMHCRAVD